MLQRAIIPTSCSYGSGFVDDLLSNLYILLGTACIVYVPPKSIMSCVPGGQLCNRHFEQLVGLRSIVQGDKALTDSVTTNLGDNINPAHIIETTDNKTEQC